MAKIIDERIVKATEKGEQFLNMFEAFERVSLALRPKDSTEQDDKMRTEFRYKALGMNGEVILLYHWESLLLRIKRKNPDASDDDIFSWFRLLLSGDWTITDLKKGIAKSTIYPGIDWDVENMRPIK